MINYLRQLRQIMLFKKAMERRFKNLPTIKLSFEQQLEEIPYLFGKLKSGCDRSYYHQHLYAKYGNIVKEENFHENTVYLFDPNDWMNLYRQGDEKPIRKTWDPLQAYRKRAPKSADLPKSCLFSDNGEDWYRLRSVVNNLILKPETVEVYFPLIDSVAVKFVDSIPHLLSEDGEMDYLHNELTFWSTQTQFVVLFGRYLGRLLSDKNLTSFSSAKFKGCMRDFFDSLFTLEINTPWYEMFDTKMFKKMGKNYELMTRMIHKSLNAVLEEQLNENSCEIGNKYPSLTYHLRESNVDVNDIFSIVCDLVIGGVNPTATAMSALMYHLSTDRALQKQMYDEVMKIAPNPAEALDVEKIRNSRYLKACFKESLRMAPVVDETSRILKRDLKTSGYKIPAGTRVVLPHRVVGNSWFTRTTTFDPVRWLRASDEEDAFPFTQWLSFGIGPRGCPGKILAEAEVCILIIRLLQKYKLSIFPNYGYGMNSGITNEPNRILNVKFTLRNEN